MTFQWKLIIDPPYNGSWNMATDEALLKIVEKNPDLIFIRLYEWLYPTISLGYNQKYSKHFQNIKNNLEIDIVRRCSGGRALFHQKELTYSFIASIKNTFARTLKDSYLFVANIIKELLKILNIEVEIYTPPKLNASYISNIFCYSTISPFEISFNNKKLVANSQRRTKLAFLQHGSIPIKFNKELLKIIFPDHNENLYISLSEILNFSPSISYLKETFKNRLLELFPEISIHKINKEEINFIRNLYQKKYLTHEWLYKKR